MRPLYRVCALGATTLLFLALAGLPAQITAQGPAAKRAAALQDLTRREWKIGDDTREALLYLPTAAKEAPCPVVFAFHGHGGTMQRAAVMFH
jgi:poly(3-hydroxybutyrate) depolymerase